MTASRTSSVLRFALAFIALALFGCSSSAKSTAPDGGYDFGDVSTVHVDAGQVHDANTTHHDTGQGTTPDSGRDSGRDSGDSGPAGCNSVQQRGASVGATQMSGAFPSALGGTIAAGTYVLIERDYYGGGEGSEPDAGGTFVQRTLVFTAATLDIAENDGVDAGPAALSSSTYEVVGKLLSITETCPTAKTVTDDLFSVITVDAASTQLWLLLSDEHIREIYALQ